jgi:hypothetical protein
VKVGEPPAFGMKPVDVRRSQNRIAVAREVAVALIIGENEDDIGPFPGERIGHARRIGDRGDKPDKEQGTQHAGRTCARANVMCRSAVHVINTPALDVVCRALRICATLVIYKYHHVVDIFVECTDYTIVCSATSEPIERSIDLLKCAFFCISIVRFVGRPG